MKKIFSFLLLGLLLSIGNAWGANGETHDFAQTLQQLLNNNASIPEINIAAQTYPINKVIVSYRYNKTLTDAVTVNVSVNGNNWGSQNVVGTGSNYTNLEFSGDDVVGAVAITFTNNTGSGTGHGTFYVNNVQLVEGSLTPTCAIPTFSPAAGNVLSGTTVTISCATEGATIYYTTDGTTPSTSSTQGTSVNITENCTVKAIAVKTDYNDSEVSSAAYTIISPKANIAALTTETETGDYYVTLSNAIVTYVNGNNAYIQDASGAVTMYKSGHGLEAGNILNGVAKVSYQLRNANPQITNMTGVTPTAGVAPTPTIVAASTWNYTFGDVLSQYFQITGATLTKTSGKYYVDLGEDNVQLYKSGTAISDLDLQKTYTITGFPTLYNTTKELQIFADPVPEETPSTDPVINADNVNLEYDATSGEIAYTIDNPELGVNLIAASETPWISNINVTADKVTFTTTANEGENDRVGYITLSYTGADDKLITVTQAHYVIDYAVLPFEWAGGASEDLLDIVGVTASGLGSDYAASNTPYLVKFDSDGDFIQVKTDSQPAKVTIGVKKIGGATVSSISVQESSDGTNFSEVQLFAINGNQNATLTLATTNAFAASTRYIKMVFTKASNVGVGPITITKVTNDPSIEFEQNLVEVDSEEHDGTIGVIYKNFTLADADVVLCDAEGNSASYTWLTAEINNENNIYYVISANTGAARTAYMKVEAMDDETNIITSDLIAVTQSACVYAVLPFEFDGGKADIETTFGLTQEGLGSDYNSSPKLKFDDTDDEVVLRINEDAGVLSFDIKGNSFSGGTFSVKISADGSNYSDLDEYTNLSNKAATNMAYSLAAGVRYIKWIYTEKDNGNVALGNIKVRKPAAAITLGANGYSTYATDFNYTVSGADAYKAKYQNGAVVLTQVNVIEAGEGIVLKGANAGDVVTITPSNATADDFSDNELVGVLTPTLAQANWYVLATNLDGDGLTKFHNCYAGIEIPANKAYIEIGAATAPSIRIIEAGNEATDIQNVEGAEKAVKFMENGKLYIQKNGVVYDAMGKTVR